MRRSEMIKLLASDICKYHRAWMGEPRVIDIQTAEHLLKTIENAGMLPPEILIEKRFGPDYDVYRNRWEPENEKK